MDDNVTVAGSPNEEPETAMSEAVKSDLSSSSTRTLMESFIFESKKVEQRWVSGNTTETDKDAAAVFLQRIGASQMDIIPDKLVEGAQTQDVEKVVKDVIDRSFPNTGSPKEEKGAVRIVPTTEDSDSIEGVKNYNGDDSYQMSSSDDEIEDFSVNMEILPHTERNDAENSGPGEKHPCPDCCTVFHSLWDLDLHMLRECEKRKKSPIWFNCDQCSRSFSVRITAIKHLQQVHDVPPNQAFAKIETLKATQRQKYTTKCHHGDVQERSPIKKRRSRKRTEESESTDKRSDTQGQLKSCKLARVKKNKEIKRSGKKSKGSKSIEKLWDKYRKRYKLKRAIVKVNKLSLKPRIEGYMSVDEVPETAEAQNDVERTVCNRTIHDTSISASVDREPDKLEVESHAQNHGQMILHETSAFRSPEQDVMAKGAEEAAREAEDICHASSASGQPLEGCNIADKSVDERDCTRKTWDMVQDEGETRNPNGDDRNAVYFDNKGEQECPNVTVHRTDEHGSDDAAPEQVLKIGQHIVIQSEKEEMGNTVLEEQETDIVSTEKDGQNTEYNNLVCQLCNLKCESYNQLMKHMSSHYGDKLFKCSTCNIAFFRRDSLRTHLLCHKDRAEGKVYRCRICSKTHICKFNHVKHTKSHFQKPERFKCSYCDVYYSGKGVLARHINTKHTKEKQYPCDQCDKVLFTNFCLKRHMAIHAKERQFKCQECGKGFYTAMNLKQHWTTVHKPATEGKVLCEVCGASFKTKQNLKQHLLHVHTGVRKLSCEICGKKFKRTSNLNSHMKCHRNDEKVIKCERCGKGFRCVAHLKVHMNWHDNIRPFSCDICGKSFLTNGNLKKHQYVHSRQWPHLCKICGHGFVNLPELRKHLDKAHEITLEKVITKGAPASEPDWVSTPSCQGVHTQKPSPKLLSTSQNDSAANHDRESTAANAATSDATDYPEADESEAVTQALLSMIS